MKKLVILFSFVFFAALFYGSAWAEMPQDDARELWEYITVESPYTEWSFWADHQGMQPGRAPHGPLHKVYVNSRGINSPQAPVQYGTIEVKENFNKQKELQAITVMYKLNDYNPEDGDWFWVKYSPEGKVDKAGKPAGCVGCHGTRAQNDFILVHEFE